MDPFADLDGLLNGSASDGSDSSEASELDLGELLGGDISVLDEGARSPQVRINLTCPVRPVVLAFAFR